MTTCSRIELQLLTVNGTGNELSFPSLVVKGKMVVKIDQRSLQGECDAGEIFVLGKNQEKNQIVYRLIAASVARSSFHWLEWQA